ncbi:MAG TPA: alkaline phosphatase family protein [Candidatus Eremiobacteraceae bacterium]|nr:alkaline phosphatase family protein [Candidatus Eremiobacteraceae bacterium]
MLDRIRLAMLVAAMMVAAIAPAQAGASNLTTPGRGVDVGLSHIKHVVIIMMENRSFDTFFGTYPGAHGIPFKNGKPSICVPDPKTGMCIYPYHDTLLKNYGAGHGEADFLVDRDNGKMDGFIKDAEMDRRNPNPDEVMGYHTAAELPIYWGFAQNYVLQDQMYSATSSWSAIAHLYMVSGWSARCTVPNDPMTCSTILNVSYNQTPEFPWTDITWLLHAANVSWGYYVYPDKGTEQMAFEDPSEGSVPFQTYSIGSDWNPLPDFDDVKEDNQLSNIQPGVNFESAAQRGALPAVSWVVPNFRNSDHPSTPVNFGQQFVQKLVDDVQNGPDWSTTAIFVSWDDWGGFFDQVNPPNVDAGGYGFRVPGLLISPWSKHGYIDHQELSFDAYLKFIEDVFLSSSRIDPNTDGRPDSRPDVREDYPGLGDLTSEFDFTQPPPIRRPFQYQH